MLRVLSLLLPLLAWAAGLQVEIRDSEVWVIRGGHARQLTRDHRPKSEPILSPRQDRIAYYETCGVAQPCIPRVIVLSLTGRRVASFHLKSGGNACASILSVAWVGNSALAAECHINPSLSEYFETNVLTGRTTRDLLGFDFTRSPDGKQVAHVGWIVHFAPPYAQSHYLQLDHTTIYPLLQGVGPLEQKGLEQPPTVVQQRGLTYSGIHEFMPGLYWSPDSERIALIDCTYDWTANHAATLSGGDGVESNRRCSLAVVSLKGEASLFPLAVSSYADLRGVSAAWTGPREVSVRFSGKTSTFPIP